MRRTLGFRSKWWIAFVQVVLLLVTTVAPAMAADTPPLTGTQFIQLLQSYGIVKGDDQGNLNLEKPITRAEMITIMIRALGGENEAILYKNFNVYSDAKGHWAEGYLNYASVKQLVKGDGNGTVRPQDYISWAEALTLMVRLAGKEPTTGSWPTNVILVAAEMGIVPDGVYAGIIRENAIRGSVFASLGETLVTATTPDNKTLLQAYIDKEPPTVTVTAPAAPTTDATARVSGTHKDAVSVVVNGRSATLSGTTWTADVDLEYGDNTVLVVAKDVAGNQATTQSKITRSQPIAKLEISGPSQVRKGGTATYQVTATNLNGQTVSLSGVSAKVEGNIGTFNLQNGTFTAANTAASGRIVVSAGTVSASAAVAVSGLNPAATGLRIRPVNDGRSVSITQDMVVTVEVVDTNGNVLTDDFGRPVSISANGISGLTVTPAQAETSSGVATFRVRSTTPGAVTLVANSSGLTAANSFSSFGTTVRVQLSAEPSALNIGTSVVVSRIRATLIDEQGQAITNNTGNDIRVTVAQTGSDGVMSDQNITIYRGLSTSTSSGDDAFYNAGTATATARITGAITSGQSMSVDPTSVTVTAPQIGSAAKWDMVYPAANLTPSSPAPAYFSIRMADGNGATVPANFAFQLEVSTSNNEPKVGGIPLGVHLTLAGSGVNPITDGNTEGAYNDGDDVIIRTMGGMATFAIQYEKVGQVYVKVVGAPGTSTAYASDNTVGAAVTGSGVPSQTFTINFTTTPTSVKLVADSTLGKDLLVGAASNTSGSQSFKVRAYFTDGANWVPGTTGTVTIAKTADADGNQTIEPSIKTISIVDGKAEFTIPSTGLAGTDNYTVTAKNAAGQNLLNATSNSVSLIVQNQNPGAPTILGAHGMKNGVPGGGWYYVAPDDTDLQLEVAPSASAGWAVVNVYQYAYSNPFYTSDPVDLSAGTVRIQIPKSKLPAGKLQYFVAFKNAVGETNPRTTTPDFITNSAYSSSITITGAKYDQVNARLYIYGTGFGVSNSTTPDTVNTHLLTITDTSLSRAVPGAGVVNLGPATIVSYYSNQITLDVSALTAPLATLSGVDVSLAAASGWYVKYTGEIAQADSGDQVGPMAKIDYVTYDKTNRRLIITGAGFNTGTLNPASLKLVKGATQLLLSSGSSYRTSDTEWTLSIAALTNVTNALDADLDYTLTGTDGWFYDSTQTTFRLKAFDSIPVYDRITVSSVYYDRPNETLIINGAGFTGATVTPGKLMLVNTAPDPDVSKAIAGTWLQGNNAAGQPQFTDSKIMIKLDAASNPLAGADRLTGSNLYLISDNGWLTKTAGAVTRTGAPIPLYVLLLPTQN